ncbi:MAG: cell division protein FtsX [Parvularcula sp.]
MMATVRTPLAKRPPVLPETGASGTPLILVIAILAFMASVALAGYFMVSHAVRSWTGDLTGTVTIQIKGVNRSLIDQQEDQAATILQQTDGVVAIDRLSPEETEKLLEPWLGKGNLTKDIPVPALISATVTPELRKDLQPLREALARAAPDASLDDHGQWNNQLVSAARRSQAVAFIVFVMVMVAAGSVIVFATRSGLAANRNIVEIMHLVGATDQFIAGQVQRRYLSLGLRGGILGALAAIVVLFIAASFEHGEQGFFLPNLGADPTIFFWLAAVPVVLSFIATFAARLTVLNVLREA